MEELKAAVAEEEVKASVVAVEEVKAAIVEQNK